MATLYLRPSAAGGETNIASQYPGSGSHYDKVDESFPDDYAAYVYTAATGYQRDLYQLENTSQTGTINWIKVWVRCVALASGYCRTAIKTGGTVYEGTQQSVSMSWANYSTQYAENPNTEEAWTWDDLNALQAGVSLKEGSILNTNCTQVYIEVDYTASEPQSICPSGIAQPIACGTPKLSLSVQPSGIAQPIAYGTPVVSAETIISPQGIAVIVFYGTPALSYPQTISPFGLSVSLAYGTPLVGELGIISPQGIVQPIALGTPTILKYVWHVVLDGQYLTESPETNRAFVIGRDAYGNPVWGEAHDTTESALVGERLDFQQESAIPTTDQAGDVASAILSKMRLTKQRGVILIPPNCGQELFDVVELTDKGANQSAVKFRVMGIRFEYNPRQARYQQRLILGAP